MSDESRVARHSFECRDQKLLKVIVYTDRAELSRLLRISLEAGHNEVLVKNLPDAFVYDSVRVNGRGPAVIHEVQFQEKPVTREEKDSPKIKAITEKLEEKLKEKEELEDRKKVAERRVELSAPDQQKESRLDVSDPNSFNKLFHFYEKNCLEQMARLNDLEKTLGTVQEEINKLECERDQLCYGGDFSREIRVLLESEKGGDVELEVIYQVKSAFWKPQYDIRVETKDKKSMTVTYSGVVNQSTGEDWKESRLILSTAQPALGGQIPQLGTLEVRFPQPVQLRSTSQFIAELEDRMENVKLAGLAGATRQVSTPVLKKKISMPLVLPQLKSTALATEFEIKRAATIPSDNTEHKVSIGVVETEPRLLHECVPGKNSSAFLTASALNSSGLAFLAGPAAVYLDGSFIAHTQLAEVSPGERFSCSLGVDTAVRIDYRPAHKFREQVGIINKAASVVHEQRIVVKNSRSSGEPLLLSIHEHLPKSTDDKIKIRLLHPVLRPEPGEKEVESEKEKAILPQEGASLDSKNNLVWTVRIAPQKEEELVVKWSIEYPIKSAIEYTEKI